MQWYFCEFDKRETTIFLLGDPVSRFLYTELVMRTFLLNISPRIPIKDLNATIDRLDIHRINNDSSTQQEQYFAMDSSTSILPISQSLSPEVSKTCSFKMVWSSITCLDFIKVTKFCSSINFSVRRQSKKFQSCETGRISVKRH